MLKNLIILALGLVVIFFILVKAFTAPPEIIPEDAVPIIATSTPAESENPVVTPGSKNVALALGQRTSYNDIIIEAAKVVEDSRCAKDVQCVWAGRAVVSLNILSPEGEHILTKELEEHAFFYAGSTKITLEKVEPYPVSTKGITDSEYQFFFILEVVE